MKPNHAITAVIASLFVCSSAAHAAPSAADKCEASKNKIAGSYFACLQKAEATAITKMSSPDYSKCSAKFDDKWDGAETKGEGMCPDNVTTPAMNAHIAAASANVTAIVGGSPPSCGDGAVNALGEHCDGSDLDGKSCASFGYPYGILQCSAGCEYDLSSCKRCPGAEYGGECYVLGSQGADCNAACGASGMVYDEATRYDVGGDGDNTTCGNVLTALGVPGTGVGFTSFDCIDGLGCLYDNGDRIRCITPETNPAAFYTGVQRVCACR